MMDHCRHSIPQIRRVEIRISLLTIYSLAAAEILPDSSFLAHILHFSPHPNQTRALLFGLSRLQFSDVKKGGQRGPGGKQGSCSRTGARLTPTAAPSEGISGLVITAGGKGAAEGASLRHVGCIINALRVNDTLTAFLCVFCDEQLSCDLMCFLII